MTITANVLIMMSCANQLPLTGGPKDEDPPQLDTAASISNYQTRFEKQDIDLIFDEFIDLKDASKQILISPPLLEPPQIAARLKKVSFKFDEEEVLKEDATYVINFGKSIRDFNESNELLNYTFVFSTGDFIDSLSLSGKVTDAKTGEPRKDVLVVLYVEDQDSIVYTDRPFYFARTDDQGVYRVNNLRADTFKIVTLSDENLDYTYDPDNEEIGFLDSLITIEDTLTADVDLYMFREATTPRYKSYDVVAQGKAKVEFAGRIEIDALRVIDSIDHFITMEEDDPYLMLWYKPRNRKTLRYEILRKGALDTVQMRINTRSVDTIEGKISLTLPSVEPKVGLHPSDNLKLSFDRPIENLDLKYIYVVDTLDQDTLIPTVDTFAFPKLHSLFSYPWPREKDLKLTFLPGAVNDYFGNTNDTIETYFYIATDTDYGLINLKTEGFDSLVHVIRLLDGKKVIQQKTLQPNETNLTFEKLPPKAYTVEIIVDEVVNGVWDPGNYLEKRQSEKIYEVPLADLRANWELEEVLDMNEIRQNLLAPISEDNEKTTEKE